MGSTFFEKINDELTKNKDIEIVSFDVYDTLLLRSTKKPADVYEYMFFQGRDLFPEYIDSSTWRTMRVQASRKANEIDLKGGLSEKAPTIYEIYDNIPDYIGDKKAIIDLEVECEKALSFLNEEIYDIIKTLKKSYNKKIILISDMYFEKCVLSSILESAGIDIGLFDGIFVSCDYSKCKSTGELYNVVAKEMGTNPEKILHIGDHRQLDEGMSRNMGFNALFYGFVSNACYDYPYLLLEDLYTRYSMSSEVFTYRLLASRLCPYTDSRKEWFEMGAMIFGPFITYGIEWVLDFAKRNHCSAIRPLMREGDFLSKLLKNSVQNKTTVFDIDPIYISRFAVFTSSFSDIKEKDIHYIMKTRGVCVRQIFEVLNIREYAKEFEEYYEMKLSDAVNIVFGDSNLWDSIFDFLTSEEMITVIRNANKNNKSNLLEYLRDAQLDEECITLDVGWRGFTQNTIDSLLDDEVINEKRKHLLLVKRRGSVSNMLSGSDIRGFVETFSHKLSGVEGMFTRIIELIMMSEQGTTIGYKRSSDKVIPVLELIHYPQEQVANLKCLQEGIEAFQTVFLNRKKTVSMLEDYEIRLFEYIERLMKYPTQKEAKLLGELEYDLNFGVNSFVKIIPDSCVEKLKTKGEELYWGKFETSELYWKEGLNSLTDAAFYLKNAFINHSNYLKLSLLYLIKEAMNYEEGSKKIVIVGAGNNGTMMLLLAKLLNYSDRIVGFVDNNEGVQYTNVDGVKIYEMEHDFGDVVYLFSLLGKADIKSIKNQISAALNRDIESISY